MSPRRRRRRSLIAGANAWLRARESALPAADRILNDPWAHRLAERAPRVQAIRALRWVVPPLARLIDHLRVAHCVRHHAIDQLALAAVRDGFRQVIVVGAGYDMRPSRFSALLADVRWIEIDDARTQSRKWRRLSGTADVHPVLRAAVDLDEEPLRDAMLRAGARLDEPTCFIAEGLVHYLESRGLTSLLDGVSAVRAKTRFVFSFIDRDTRAHAGPGIKALFRVMREKPRSFLSTDELSRMLGPYRLVLTSTWTLQQQVAAFVSPAVANTRRLSARWSQIVAVADSLAGAWVEDPAVDEALREQRRIRLVKVR